MNARRSIGKRTRFEVFKRDGFACVYCGAGPTDRPLHVDHVKPVVEGGANDPANLVTACEACNLGKGAAPLGANRLAPVPRVTEADLEHAEQIREYLRIQGEIAEARRAVVAMLVREWEMRVGSTPQALVERLPGMVAELGVARLLAAFDIVRARKGCGGVDGLKYLHGILRKWREVAANTPADDGAEVAA